MKAGQKPAYVAVLDGTTTAAGRQARALGAFLHAGVTWTTAPDGTTAQPAGVTLLFYAGDGDRERLVEIAPTRDVVLVRTPARRPDLMAAAVERFAEDTGRESLRLRRRPPRHRARHAPRLPQRRRCRHGRARHRRRCVAARRPQGRLLGPPHRARRARPAPVVRHRRRRLVRRPAEPSSRAPGRGGHALRRRRSAAAKWPPRPSPTSNCSNRRRPATWRRRGSSSSPGAAPGVPKASSASRRRPGAWAPPSA